MNIRNPHYKQGLFWAFLLFISYSFLAPAADAPGIDIPYLDKIAHTGIFFVLALLAKFAYQLKPLPQIFWFGAYGALIEVLQAQTGYRSGDIYDWLADMLGIGLMLLSSHYFDRQFKSNRDAL